MIRVLKPSGIYTRKKNGAGVDHKNVINYDDVNEFFSYRSKLDDTDGFKFYSNVFTSDIKDTRNHIFYSIFMTISGSQDGLYDWPELGRFLLLRSVLNDHLRVQVHVQLS
ncbi:hypothetical protein PPTG_21167 [Phytophthora nicotianae INRA-310]|uniref:Uncharacterized protein n=1 Tax=Phytophthora nicotianae (strain INRA-310) TaxID=761204 RepID=W2RBL8_PHYN3|nr:hypothetical protein PPTG_21167 [Phytophthora nicotianae INRA-310]ETN21935.1 hypothetical protein PPTG_21167 [Phytophthora nicotianae INRA-310]